VTCYARTPEKRQAFSQKYGCDQEKSFEDVLKRDDVEGLLLVTPNAVHAEHAVLAAQHGKHVYVDKLLPYISRWEKDDRSLPEGRGGLVGRP